MAIATLKKKRSRLSSLFSASSSTDLAGPAAAEQPQESAFQNAPPVRSRQNSLVVPPAHTNLHPDFVPNVQVQHRAVSGPAYTTHPAPANLAPPAPSTLPPPVPDNLAPPATTHSPSTPDSLTPPSTTLSPPPADSLTPSTPTVAPPTPDYSGPIAVLGPHPTSLQPGLPIAPQPFNIHEPAGPPAPVPGGDEPRRSRSPMRKSASHANLLVPGTEPTMPVDGARSQPGSRQPSPSAGGRGGRRRKSWFAGGIGGVDRSRSRSRSRSQLPRAWVVTAETPSEGADTSRAPLEEYPISRLFGGSMIPELWDPTGDTLIHLFPEASKKGPSFRIHSNIYADSVVLNQLARPNQGLDEQMSAVPLSPDSSTQSSDATSAASLNEVPREIHIYIPLPLSNQTTSMPGDAEQRLSAQDMDALIDVRNMFAFLVGQSLIATERKPSAFHVFMKVAEQLTFYEFSNFDGSTFGEAANTSFTLYIDELGLADVRTSREKTIEAVVLAERMRSVVLYNEAFVHAVGKYEEFDGLASPTYDLISPMTLNRLERAHMDLLLRQQTIGSKLDDFQFPFLFAGIMNSKTSEEAKLVRFDVWKEHFMATRRFILSHYKDRFGSWPPRANPKKNNFTMDGLNRMVLKFLYADLAQLYDLLVDRTSLTPRSYDGVTQSTDRTDPAGQLPMAIALRRVLTEYDQSVPPVLPPIPFDLPIFPSVGRPEPSGDPKISRSKLRDEEIQTALTISRNSDAAQVPTPFLAAFTAFEAKRARGATLDDLRDLRAGIWLFLYAVFNSLPLLVVDAPGVRYVDGVEYFLCQPPRAAAPWVAGAGGSEKTWFGVAGTSGVVSMPVAVIEHSVEGVYRRSHAWVRGDAWAHALSLTVAPPAAVQPSAAAGMGPPTELPRKGSAAEFTGEQSVPTSGPGTPSLGVVTPPAGMGTPPLAVAPGGEMWGMRRVSRVLDTGLMPVGPPPLDTIISTGRSRQGSLVVVTQPDGAATFPTAGPGRNRALSQGNRNPSMTFDDILGPNGNSGTAKKRWGI